MPTGGIPENVRQFVFEHIDSVELLEVLLLLRAHAERAWTADDVSASLRTNSESASNRLLALKGLNLIVEANSSPASYRYAPATPALTHVVDATADAYKLRRHKMYELIFSPLKRARSFADAFRIGKSDKNEGGDG